MSEIEPLSPDEEALYREGLRTAPSINRRYGPDPVTLHGISTAEWADRCRRLLATLDAARTETDRTRGALVTLAQWDLWASEWLAKHPKENT